MGLVCVSLVTSDMGWPFVITLSRSARPILSDWAVSGAVGGCPCWRVRVPDMSGVHAVVCLSFPCLT